MLHETIEFEGWFCFPGMFLHLYVLCLLLGQQGKESFHHWKVTGSITRQLMCPSLSKCPSKKHWPPSKARAHTRTWPLSLTPLGDVRKWCVHWTVMKYNKLKLRFSFIKLFPWNLKRFYPRWKKALQFSITRNSPLLHRTTSNVTEQPVWHSNDGTKVFKLLLFIVRDADEQSLKVKPGKTVSVQTDRQSDGAESTRGEWKLLMCPHQSDRSTQMIHLPAFSPYDTWSTKQSS